MWALPFRVSATEAYSTFEHWAVEQGPFFRVPTVRRISSYYLPMWSFEGDLEVRAEDDSGRVVATYPLNARRLYERPADPDVSPEEREGDHRVVDYEPFALNLQVYAGQQFPRSLLDVTRTAPEHAQRFDPSMMDGAGGPVDVEPFALYDSTAFRIATERVLEAERAYYHREHPGPARTLRLVPAGTATSARSAKGAVSSHRLLVPVHIVTYENQGRPFRLFVNGFTGRAYGIEQATLASVAMGLVNRVRNLSDILESSGVPRGQILGIAVGVIRSLMVVFSRFILAPPVFITASIALGAYAYYVRTRARRVQDATYEEWEAQRAQEAAEQPASFARHDFTEWHFRRDAGRPGDMTGRRTQQQRAQEEERARRGWQQYRDTRYRSTSSASSTSSSSTSTSKRSRGKQPPPVNPGDYYAVLGIPRSANTADIKAAFRRELMKYHPDHNRSKSNDWDMDALQERSRLIIEAYTTLRNPSKRRDYDAYH